MGELCRWRSSWVRPAGVLAKEDRGSATEMFVCTLMECKSTRLGSSVVSDIGHGHEAGHAGYSDDMTFVVLDHVG